MTSIPRTRVRPEVHLAAEPAEIRRRVATLERRGMVALIRPSSCARWLDSLRTERYTLDPEHGYQFTRVSQPLTWELQDATHEPVIGCPAGLESVAGHLLERAGYQVTWSGERPSPLKAPARANIEPHGRIDEDLLALVQSHDRGVIRYDRAGVDPAWMVAQIALAYPRMRMAVLAVRMTEVRALAQRLRVWLPDVSYATGKSLPARSCRIHVATPWSLGYFPSRSETRKAFFFVDAAAALGRKPTFALGHTVSRARLYGLLDRAQPMAPHEADEVSARFGLNEVVIPRHGFRDRPVEVHSQRIRGGPVSIPASDGIAIKRAALWRHPVRNRRIARLAASLASPHSNRDLDLPAAWIERRRGLTAPRILILVENLEHALALAVHLPGWSLHVDADAHLAGLSHRERRRLRQGRRPFADAIDRSITTLAALDARMLRNLDVLIRADGGTHCPPALTSNPVDARQTLGPLLLVDCADRHHPRLRRLWRSRRDAYLAQGWSVDGTSPASAIERFLASRAGEDL